MVSDNPEDMLAPLTEAASYPCYSQGRLQCTRIKELMLLLINSIDLCVKGVAGIYLMEGRAFASAW